MVDRLVRVLMPVALAGNVVGCDLAPAPVSPLEACAAEARAYDGTVVGAFGATVGAIRRYEAARPDQQRWPGVVDHYPAILCFIDGDIRKALGGGDNAFDRAVVGIVDGRGEMVMAGFRDRLPVQFP